MRTVCRRTMARTWGKAAFWSMTADISWSTIILHADRSAYGNSLIIVLGGNMSNTAIKAKRSPKARMNLLSKLSKKLLPAMSKIDEIEVYFPSIMGKFHNVRLQLSSASQNRENPLPLFKQSSKVRFYGLRQYETWRRVFGRIFLTSEPMEINFGR